MVQLSVVTVCMNRQKHLMETAPRVQAWADQMGLIWEHVVVDWNSAVPLKRECLPTSPSLQLLRVEGEQEWCASRAYNFGFAQAQGELLMRLDADCWPERLSVEQLEQLPEDKMLEGAMGGGSEGSWLMHQDSFVAVGGYNELIRGYGCDDIDLRARLKINGVSIKTLSREAIKVIRHENDLRVGYIAPSKSGCSSSLAKSWKNALIKANHWVVVQYPWSRHRHCTIYQCRSDGIWKAVVSSLPKPSDQLDQQLQLIRRSSFWSEFLLLPKYLLEQLPEAWFGGFDGRGFGVRRWHRLYWCTGRRLMVVLRQLLIHCIRRCAG